MKWCEGGILFSWIRCFKVGFGLWILPPFLAGQFCSFVSPGLTS
jgi:hypothetical protein